MRVGDSIIPFLVNMFAILNASVLLSPFVRTPAGWYFKMVTPGVPDVLSIIVGLLESPAPENSTAFIMVLESEMGASQTYFFPASEFSASEERIDVRLAGNHFTRDCGFPCSCRRPFHRGCSVVAFCCACPDQETSGSHRSGVKRVGRYDARWSSTGVAFSHTSD